MKVFKNYSRIIECRTCLESGLLFYFLFPCHGKSQVVGGSVGRWSGGQWSVVLIKYICHTMLEVCKGKAK